MEFTHDLSQKFDISRTESAFFWKRLRYDASWWKEGFLNYENIIFYKKGLDMIFDDDLHKKEAFLDYYYDKKFTKNLQKISIFPKRG